jgi:hypothetical protein
VFLAIILFYKRLLHLFHVATAHIKKREKEGGEGKGEGGEEREGEGRSRKINEGEHGEQSLWGT